MAVVSVSMKLTSRLVEIHAEVVAEGHKWHFHGHEVLGTGPSALWTKDGRRPELRYFLLGLM